MAELKTKTGRGMKRQMTNADRGRFYPGQIVNGVITDHDYSRMTYTVMANNQATTGVVDMSGPFSALFGFKGVQRLTPGTIVSMVFGQPSYILGTRAADPPDTSSFQSRITTGTAIVGGLDKINDSTATIPCHNHPDDLYQGEFEISNLIGTFIRFMTFMASIGSGERAKIECHILRDLVRIVSGNFEHFSAAGDFKIFDDGRLNTELNGTTYPHERWGKQRKNDPKFEINGTDMPEVDPLETGRWRYTMLLGHIGDLLNAWFTDPPGAVGRMAEECIRSGKARMHVGQDGNILIQSTSEIVLERVSRIQVPIRLKHEEDPQGVVRKELDKLTKEQAKFLELWDQGDKAGEHHTLFQIREYARYLNQYHSLARILIQEKDWKVPSEDDTPQPTVGAFEDDRIDANNGKFYWKDCYSTIRIFRDGSTLIHDAYGNVYASGAFGIHLGSTRHITMYAAGDISLTAGGSLFISARRHIEAVAHRGSLLLKGRTGLRALCEKGTMWLKSDFDPDNPYTPEDGDPEADVVDRQGVRVQAVKSETRWISNLKARFIVEKKDERLEVSAKGDIKINTTKNLLTEAKEGITIKTAKALSVIARVCSNWLEKGWLLNRVCALVPGGSAMNHLEVESLKSPGPIKGPKNTGRPEPGPGSYKAHTNHILEYKNPEEILLELEEDPPTLEPDQPETSGFSWKLLTADEYTWNNPGLAAGKENFDFEPLSNQTIRLAEDNSGYGDWERVADFVIAAPQTMSTLPWPGPDFRWYIHETDAPDLQLPTTKEAKDFGPDTKTELTISLPTFKFLTK